MTRLVVVVRTAGEEHRLEVDAGERRASPDPAVVPLVTGIGADARRRSRGDASVDGVSLRGWSVARRVRRGVVGVVEAPVARDVSVRDHLAVRVGTVAAEGLVAGCPLLAARGRDPAGVLSGGERRALAWLRAAAVAPRVVVLSGATVGLDADTVAWTEGLVAGWLAAGAAVVDA